METALLSIKSYFILLSPHSLGKLIEWKLLVIKTELVNVFKSPLAGETN